MSESREVCGDAMDAAHRSMAQLVLNGAAHVTMVVTYDDGQQVVLRSSSDSEGFTNRLASIF